MKWFALRFSHHLLSPTNILAVKGRFFRKQNLELQGRKAWSFIRRDLEIHYRLALCNCAESNLWTFFSPNFFIIFRSSEKKHTHAEFRFSLTKCLVFYAHSFKKEIPLFYLYMLQRFSVWGGVFSPIWQLEIIFGCYVASKG